MPFIRNNKNFYVANLFIIIIIIIKLPIYYLFNERSYHMKSLDVLKVNCNRVLITPTIRVRSDHMSIYPYGHDHTRMIQILIWSGTYILKTQQHINELKLKNKQTNKTIKGHRLLTLIGQAQKCDRETCFVRSQPSPIHLANVEWTKTRQYVHQNSA